MSENMNEEKKDKVERPEEKEFFEKLAEIRKEDPLVGVKYGSEDIFKSLMIMATDDKGVVNVHDVVLYAAGLAGYACQAAVMETEIIRDQKKFNDVFHLILGPNESKFIFGDAINDYLFGNKYSVWNLLSAKYKKMYPRISLPSPAPVIKKVTANIANPEYKVCGEQPVSTLLDMYALLWKNIYKKMRNYCPNPEEWPVLYGMVLQKCFEKTKGILEPTLAINFTIEATIFASKADLGSRMM